MSALLPAAVYGLEVPPGEVLIPAHADFPSAFRITMAALDPTAAPEHPADMPEDAPPRATLKLFRIPISDDESEDEDDEDDEMDALINGDYSDEDDSDEEANGGPSDPAKSKKAQREASIQALKEALAKEDDDEEDDEEMDGVSGKVNKGKGVALGDDSDDEEDGDPTGLDQYVVCTLSPTSHYQQTLDITVGENESVFFQVIGTHTIFLTGNYVMPVDDTPRGLGYGPEEDDYDESDEDELDYDEDEESDDLDDIDDPRIMEVDSDEEDAPKLIAAASGKGNKKRAAEEEETLDEIMAKAAGANGLSKKQQKKLKNNAGEAATAPATKDEKKSDKKVQFAKNLEQGPTGSTAGKKEEKKDNQKKADEEPTGVRTVKGIKIDDRKIGKGPAAKKGSQIGMRYIGKLENGQQFDSNKKGKPFSFKLGAGSVIQGWEIGVEGMKVGGERRITVPPKLAYGNKALSGIPKNSTLIFDLKLIELK